MGTAATVVLFLGAPTGALAAGTSYCGGWVATEGVCQAPEANGEFNGGGVDVSAGYDQTGGGGGNSGAGSGQENGSGSGTDGTGTDNTGPGPDPLTGDLPGGPPPIVRDWYTINCIPNSPCDPNFVVHISDLVNFVPAPPTTTMEPSGWAVIGLPVNLTAEASPHILSGMLLGYEAQVRFTPLGFRWDYGDGTSATTTGGGASWAALDLPEFSPTETSHVFRTRGTWTVSVAVEYAADYRFANGLWQRIGGTLAVSSSPLTAIALDARTLLVGGDCQGVPGGPGC